MFTFATPSGQPRHFSPNMVLHYDCRTGILTATEDGHPVFFNKDNQVSDNTFLEWMNIPQFLKLCEMMTATMVTEFVSYMPVIANGTATVTFVVDVEAAVAAESPA